MNLTNVAGIDIFVLFIALVEVVTAIYTLVLAPREKANQYLTALLFIFAVNSWGMGRLLMATNAEQAWLPTILLAATLAIQAPGVLMSFVVLFYPDWTKGRWRLAWWSGYLVTLLPIIFTLIDAFLGTQWWFVPLDAANYSGGYVEGIAYLQGRLAPFVRFVYLWLSWLFALGMVLYIGWQNQEVSGRARRMARLLTGWLVVHLLFTLIPSSVTGGLWPRVLSHIIFVSIIAFSGMTQSLSDVGLVVFLARLPIRRKLQMGFAMSAALTLMMGAITLYVISIGQNTVIRTLVAKHESADLITEVTVGFLEVQTLTTDLGNTWQTTRFESSEFADVQRRYVQPIISQLDHLETKLAELRQIETDAALADLEISSQTYRQQLLALINAMEQYGHKEAGAMSHLSKSGLTLKERLQTSDLSDETITFLEMRQLEENFFQHADSNSATQVHELAQQLRTQIREADNSLLSATDRDDIVELLDTHLLAFDQAVDLRTFIATNLSTLTESSQSITSSVADLFARSEASYRVTLPEAARNQSRLIALVLCTLILLLNSSGLIAYVLSTQIAKPIQSLGQAAASLEKDDLSVRVAVIGRDEIASTSTAFNAMANRLQELLTVLEQEVSERTKSLARRARQIEVAAEVGRVVTSVLDSTDLLNQVVNSIGEHFGFYHVGIFLLDDRREWAVLHAANSPGGKKMLKRGHQLRLGGESLVGWAAFHRRPRIALDVGADAMHFKNPFLPETRSEMALPIIIGDRVMGVLDVQSVQESAFDNEDIAVLQLVTDQVAIAMENARLFAETQSALQELRAFYRSYSEEVWRTTVARTEKSVGYRFGSDGLTDDPRDHRPEIEEAVRTGRPVAWSNDSQPPVLAVPVVLRGQIIGAIDFRRGPGDEDWSDADLALAEAISNQLALALENARLVQEAQHLALREQQINLISSQVRNSTGLESILQNTVRELGKALGVTRTFIQLDVPEGFDHE